MIAAAEDADQREDLSVTMTVRLAVDRPKGAPPICRWRSARGKRIGKIMRQDESRGVHQIRPSSTKISRMMMTSPSPPPP
jgi:hypothetical protein